MTQQMLAMAPDRAPAVHRDRDRPVSVCVPAYNGALYIDQALRSVLHQSWGDFELLVVDDGSRDGTADLVAAVRDDRVRFVRNARRLGLVGNWNRCLHLARGRHVVVFHQDDVMAPDNLRAKLEVLEADPGLGFVHSNVREIDVQGRVVAEGWSAAPTPPREGRHDGRALFASLVGGANLVCAPSVMVPRGVFQRLGGFDPRLPFTADWEMWLRIALFHDVGYLARPLVSYRRHEAMETLRLPPWTRLHQVYLAKMLVLDKYADRVPGADALRRRTAEEYRDRALVQARHALERGDGGHAAEYLKVALAVSRRLPGEPDAAAVMTALGGGAAEGRDALEARLAAAERTIDAMTRTRAWRLGRGWWSIKARARRLLGR